MVGLSYKDFNPVLVQTSLAINKAYGTEGVLYGIPLDTHTSIIYYNKDILKKAGLLGSDGKPIASAFTGIANFTKSLDRIKSSTGMLPMAMSSANDPARSGACGRRSSTSRAEAWQARARSRWTRSTLSAGPPSR